MKRRKRLWKSGRMAKMKLLLFLLLAFRLLLLAPACKCRIPTPPHQQQDELSAAAAAGSSRASFLYDELLVVGSSWQQELLLPCRILHLDEQQTVSWIRLRDSLVLSVGQLMLAGDPRFRLARGSHSAESRAENLAPSSSSHQQPHQLLHQDWSLIVSEPRNEDAGAYECQVPSLEPKLSQLVELRLVEADSYINAPNLSSLIVHPNQPIRLTCHIRAPQQTHFLYWYKNQQPIQYQRLKRALPGATSSTIEHPPPPPNERLNSKSRVLLSSQLPAGLNQSQEEAPKPVINLVASSSTLLIEHSQLNESANFTCLPSNAKPSQISVFVIESGPQSQPEKRSLQASSASSSSSSSLRPTWTHRGPIQVLVALLAPAIRRLCPSTGGRRHVMAPHGLQPVAGSQHSLSSYFLFRLLRSLFVVDVVATIVGLILNYPRRQTVRRRRHSHQQQPATSRMAPQ